MKSFLLFLTTLLFFTQLSFAQAFEDCGTEMSQQDMLVIQNALKSSLDKDLRTPADSTVPIKFHIIATSNGLGGIDSAAVFNELASVNAFYLNAGIQFIHCGNIDYINNSLYANFEKGISETICDQQDLPNVVNVYFAPNVFRMSGSNTVQLCGYAYTSSITKNRVVMDNDCSTNGSTLVHELGHYFSLAHTHETSGGAELVNGTNCSTAGDDLCDTPADPGLSTLNVSSTCSYTGTGTDANNQVYAPNVRNIMSYSRKSCRTEFSNGQYNRMKAYFASYRNYLSCAPVAVQNVQAVSGLSVFPNPTADMLNISAADMLQHLTIYDQTGRVLIHQTINKQAISIDVSSLTNGVYFYQLYCAQGSAHGKLLKQ